MIVKPTFADVLAFAHTAQIGMSKGTAPVHLWNPPFCGDLDMRIAADGTWFYLGSPIGRVGMVKLFSSILKREEGKYFLVTPVEKVGIIVDDVPFVAVDVQVQGLRQAQELIFETHVGDCVTANQDHPIRLIYDPITQEPRPYVMVRSGLEARIDRKSFYRMVAMGQVESIDGQDWFGLWSGRQFFALSLEKDLRV
ncbi:MAG: DUF1285 domain-containing protein [Paracoccaceae bacterium]